MKGSNLYIENDMLHCTLVSYCTLLSVGTVEDCKLEDQQGNKKRRSTEQCQENYQRCIYRIAWVTIGVGKKLQISADLIKIVNQILVDFFDKIA